MSISQKQTSEVLSFINKIGEHFNNQTLKEFKNTEERFFFNITMNGVKFDLEIRERYKDSKHDYMTSIRFCLDSSYYDYSRTPLKDRQVSINVFTDKKLKDTIKRLEYLMITGSEYKQIKIKIEDREQEINQKISELKQSFYDIGVTAEYTAGSKIELIERGSSGPTMSQFCFKIKLDPNDKISLDKIKKIKEILKS